MKNKMWNNLIVGFINGIVTLLPITITVVIIRFIVIKVNNVVLDPLLGLFAPMADSGMHIYLAKGVIFIGVIITVALIGWAARILVINRAFSSGERLLLRLPIMGRIYNAVKQISHAFIGQGKTIFKQVVLVEYPRRGLYSIGFTTGVTKGEIRVGLGKSGINVFVPTTPNPTSGVFLVVPKEEIHFLKMSVEEGMKLVVSGGSVSPPYAGKEE
jgi:uncharacterized membrane protein